ncbi:MAG: redoxin domain-containing protein [Bacteroidales bacterium]|nr:redoxin domain-containing protein [Bacteroidales bacterium]
MKRLNNAIGGALALLLCFSCSQAGFKGTVADAAGKDVVVKKLAVNKYTVLDTLKVAEDGSLSYKLPVKAGCPEFVYVYYGDTKVASMILDKGSKVSFEADTLGAYTVSGSADCDLLATVEKDYAAFLAKEDGLSWRLTRVDANSSQAAAIRREMTDEYVAYYRSRIKLILENPYSIAIVPVFYQTLGDMPVFSQNTDAIHFDNAAKNLETVYPSSPYVRALKLEAKSRQQGLSLGTRIAGAEEVAYPEIELPDLYGEKKKLSEVDGKFIILHFWTALEPTQSMFNTDTLLPLYEKYYDKGLRIYQVSFDADKASWATVVKNQNLPWTSVCDSRGTASPYINLYGIASLPLSYFLLTGEGFVNEQANDDKELEAIIAKYLK